ncbi:heat-inducible transcriptional repressor HrcA [Corynebacterium sp. 320]|uniref:Heat-inducible transcription repressor HrcA n=1 Tax=Corynebacterium zhongnanshanii TaxID=2768834 RepID=A0ABQ6VDZ9_9CORY|nr:MULTISPECIES: heat-inducible transcriptional repressor HrcA [Corynebacterium]KAB1502412.1 heat-inducible transcriptional repressor HrcA [Corynebacterium sp. 320]KAB1551367.1 heat-inducible transcriptional repressor HrcA [Corynebacterium sp. 321]KAB1551804.1 heat-inducible transcriptional repressor HrcA [Corynebacterium sp. 319]KAB3520907.1 heat-inducible transcriptional repressor HrcA [Corynebacterium zhongnanshanii]KAB3526019.1 heat-inducible transcriptional repressor HrcA [Corynebacterium
MSSGTEQRRNEVLRAIVTDFIASHEPVGSKMLVDRHKLNVSSATIRNDMAALETEGYITQQHASSGRIPTAKGYRRFVDGIHDIKPLSRPERKAILDFLNNGVDLEDVLRRSAQLLAQLTRQVAVVQMPDLHRGRVKHCEVVKLGSHRVLLVLITDTGRVDQRNVDLMDPLPDEDVPHLRDIVNASMVGKTLDDACAAIAAVAREAKGQEMPRELRRPVLAVATVLVETLLDRPTDKLILAGTPNLVRTGELTAVLEALEEQVVVLKLLSSARDLQVQVSIGEENEDDALHRASVVTTGYGTSEGAVGGLGVIGPTHLDYTGTISSVTAVAHYVSRIVAGEK